METRQTRQDIVRTTLAVASIGSLAFASIWIVRPFLPATIWASTIVIATWPLMLQLERVLWNKRGLAVAAATLLLLLAFFVPFSLAVSTVAGNSDYIIMWAQSFGSTGLPAAPGWIADLPIVGTRLFTAWQQASAGGPEGLVARVQPYVGTLVRWFASRAGSAGMMTVHFFLTVIITAILFTNAETAARGIRRFAYRLAGQRGEDATVLAAKAIRGVALGVVVTALVQSLLGGIGLAVAGIPATAVLTAIMFILCLAQLGPILVLLPAVIWLYWSGQNVWGTCLLVWTVLVGLADNFIRPVLIRKGADLPLLLILAGVIGGLIAFGVVGIFIGPTLLAVTYTLLGNWVNSGMREGEGN